METIAPTLTYDAACIGDGRPTADRLARVTQATLVLTGDAGADQEYMSGLPPRVFEEAADAITAGVPNAERRTLEAQGHVVEAKVLAPVLERFFGS